MCVYVCECVDAQQGKERKEDEGEERGQSRGQKTWQRLNRETHRCTGSQYSGR